MIKDSISVKLSSLDEQRLIELYEFLSLSFAMTEDDDLKHSINHLEKYMKYNGISEYFDDDGGMDIPDDY